MKVGDYVRTKYGEIRKVVKSTDDVFILDDDILEAHKYSIVKSSPNIIDLIEVGDYVNGYKIMNFDDEYYDYDIDDYVEGKSIVLGNEEGMYKIPPKDIKSIVTKEQFESMKYKI